MIRLIQTTKRIAYTPIILCIPISAIATTYYSAVSAVTFKNPMMHPSISTDDVYKVEFALNEDALSTEVILDSGLLFEGSLIWFTMTKISGSGSWNPNGTFGSLTITTGSIDGSEPKTAREYISLNFNDPSGFEQADGLSIYDFGISVETEYHSTDDPSALSDASIGTSFRDHILQDMALSEFSNQRFGISFGEFNPSSILGDVTLSIPEPGHLVILIPFISFPFVVFRRKPLTNRF